MKQQQKKKRGKLYIIYIISLSTSWRSKQLYFVQKYSINHWAHLPQKFYLRSLTFSYLFCIHIWQVRKERKGEIRYRLLHKPWQREISFASAPKTFSLIICCAVRHAGFFLSTLLLCLYHAVYIYCRLIMDSKIWYDRFLLSRCRYLTVFVLPPPPKTLILSSFGCHDN